MQASSFQGTFRVGGRLMSADTLAAYVHGLKESAPIFNAEEQFQPKNIGRVLECVDAVWCANEIISGGKKSGEAGKAMAAYAEGFSQDAYMTDDPLTSLTAITVLGHDSVHRSILENKWGTKIAGCLRSAATVGQPAQRYAAAIVLGRYAINAAKVCDSSILLSAMSALTDVMSMLRDNRSKLYPGYGPLMVSILRSLASVSQYVGQNAVSAEAMDSLRVVAKLDEIPVIRESAAMVMAAIEAEPKPMQCGPTVTFSSGSGARKSKGVAA